MDDEQLATIPARAWDKAVGNIQVEGLGLLADAYISGICDALELDYMQVLQAMARDAEKADK